MTVLFENGIADGPSPGTHTSTGGNQIYTVTGVFDGASITLQLRSPNDPNMEWVSLPNSVLTQAGNKLVEFAPKAYSVRAVISSAGGSTDLFAEVTT